MKDSPITDRAKITYEAILVDNNGSIPIKAKYYAKFAVLIKFQAQTDYPDGQQFNKLIFVLDHKQVELGACRYIAHSNSSDYSGYLVFENEIYDLDSLFFQKKRSVLQGPFHNLPIILEHKNKIKQAFKDYTADLTYDLSVYKNMFDSLDAEIEQEPEAVRAAVQHTIITSEGAAFLDFFDGRLQELERIVAGYSKEEHERHGYYFRRQVWSYILHSPMMKRANLKPRGYAGDSEMMRLIYLKEDLGRSMFSRLLHKHPIHHPAAEAVRNRRKLIATTLMERLQRQELPPGERFKILSVACGPAFELQDILTSPEQCERYEFTLFDQDEKALAEAAELVRSLEKSLVAEIKVEYLQESVRTMLSTRRLASKWGQFHFIYSMGLFDYLLPPVARAVLTNLYQLLQPGGVMIVGNFHESNKSRIYMEYWNDWVLYYRKEQDMLKLLKNAPDAQQEVILEDTGSQMFLIIERAANRQTSLR